MARSSLSNRCILIHGFTRAASFVSFLTLTHQNLDSNQVVTITTVTPPVQARIIGISLDYGLLRTVPVTQGGGREEFIDLQPDGNSFDMMAGLIKMKSR